MWFRFMIKPPLSLCGISPKGAIYQDMFLLLPPGKVGKGVYA
jgi:hypothetical protein